MAKCYQWLTFEKTSIISFSIITIGALLALKVILKWMQLGFGTLNEPRLLFLSLVLLVNGVQISAASYLFSIMALPRHIDDMPTDLKGCIIYEQFRHPPFRWLSRRLTPNNTYRSLTQSRLKPTPPNEIILVDSGSSGQHCSRRLAAPVGK